MAKTEIFWVDGENPKLIEAFNNAQKTFKYFWRELSWEYRRIVPALTLACVKVAFSQNFGNENDPRIEHMWINEIEFDGENVSGILINEPHELTNIKNGDFVRVPLSQISDWLFTHPDFSAKKGISKVFSKTPKPKTCGGFTIQHLRSEMNETERKNHDNAWGLNFGDYNEVFVVMEQTEHPENLIEHPMSKNMKEKLTELLIENPNEITFKDENGMNLLHREATAGNLTSVEVLLAHGADKSSKTDKGETPLDLAKKMGWEHIIKVLEN